MLALFKQLEIILSASSIQPELEAAELVVIDENEQCWKFFCNPSLKLESVKFEDLKKFNGCILRLSENTLRSILKNEFSAQDAYQQKLITAQGSVAEVLRSNLIIDSLCGLSFV